MAGIKNINNVKENMLVSFFSRAGTERMIRKEKWKTIIMIIVKRPLPIPLVEVEVEVVRNHPLVCPQQD